MTSSLPRPVLAIGALALLLSGCATGSEVLALRCDVTVDEIAPQPAKVGDAVTLTGTPYTSVYDSAVYVDGLRATVTDVDRSGCGECDVCREQSGCTECTDCDQCDRICETSCTETVTFEVPPVDAGAHSLQVFNAHGQSPVVELQVQSTGFSSDEDSGAPDSGTTDDSGIADTAAAAATGS